MFFVSSMTAVWKLYFNIPLTKDGVGGGIVKCDVDFFQYLQLIAFVYVREYLL